MCSSESVTTNRCASSGKGSSSSALSNFRDQLHNLGRDAAGNYTAALSVVSSQLDPVRTQADKLASQASLANAKAASTVIAPCP